MTLGRLRRTIGSEARYSSSGVGTTNYTNSLYRGRMQNNDLSRYHTLVGTEKEKQFIICGCGTSLNDFIPDDKSVLFGVNDISRKLKTKYLICVNEPHTFKRGRFEWVQNHTSDYFFTHLSDLVPVRHETVVYVNLGTRGGTAIDNIGLIDYTANSTYMAVIIAYQLGASKIGLIGVDLTPNHFFGETGDHLLTKRHESVDGEYMLLGEKLKSKGVKIANLSPISLIKSWPYMTHEEFNNL